MEEFRAIEKHVQTAMGDPSMHAVKTVQGGIVNKAALFRSANNNDDYFVKINKNSVALELFEAESNSLQFLEKINIITVPKSFKVVEVKDVESCTALHVLQYIPNLQPMSSYWSEFGEKMARLHTFNSSLKDKAVKGESVGQHLFNYVHKFGSTSPRYFGEFRLAPVQRDTWEEYFVGDIMNNLFQGVEEKYGNRDMSSQWSWLQLNLHKLFNDVTVKPELIHGDLCLANFGQTADGPVLFDPSICYAHYEMDLLLSEFENKFHEDFFTSYRRILPLETGFEKRLEAYRLFYNVIMWYHVNEEQFKQGCLQSMETVTNYIKSM